MPDFVLIAIVAGIACGTLFTLFHLDYGIKADLVLLGVSTVFYTAFYIPFFWLIGRAF